MRDYLSVFTFFFLTIYLIRVQNKNKNHNAILYYFLKENAPFPTGKLGCRNGTVKVVKVILVKMDF
jgi:hypothetical protein